MGTWSPIPAGNRSTPEASARIKSLEIKRGVGCYRLFVMLEVNIPALHKPRGDLDVDHLVLEGFRGEIAVGTPKLDADYLGLIGPPSTAPAYFQAGQLPNMQELRLETELDAHRIEAIEALRNGGGVRFSISLNVDGQGPGTRTQRAFSVWHDVEVSEWVRLLEKAGFSRTILLEVPAPTDADPRLVKALGKLDQARSKLDRGDWRDAVGMCREVIEVLAIEIKDDDSKDPDFSSIFADTRKWNKEKRVRMVRRALRVLTHPARHADEVSEQHEFDREDALAIMTAMSAMLRLVAKR